MRCDLVLPPRCVPFWNVTLCEVARCDGIAADRMATLDQLDVMSRECGGCVLLPPAHRPGFGSALGMGVM